MLKKATPGTVETFATETAALKFTSLVRIETES